MIFTITRICPYHIPEALFAISTLRLFLKSSPLPNSRILSDVCMDFAGWRPEGLCRPSYRVQGCSSKETDPLTLSLLVKVVDIIAIHWHKETSKASCQAGVGADGSGQFDACVFYAITGCMSSSPFSYQSVVYLPCPPGGENQAYLMASSTRHIAFPSLVF